MKKNQLFYGLLMATALLAFSCSKEAAPTPNSPDTVNANLTPSTMYNITAAFGQSYYVVTDVDSASLIITTKDLDGNFIEDGTNVQYIIYADQEMTQSLLSGEGTTMGGKITVSLPLTPLTMGNFVLYIQEIFPDFTTAETTANGYWINQFHDINDLQTENVSLILPGKTFSFGIANIPAGLEGLPLTEGTYKVEYLIVGSNYTKKKFDAILVDKDGSGTFDINVMDLDSGSFIVKISIKYNNSEYVWIDSPKITIR